MKKTLLIWAALIALTGCGNTSNNTSQQAADGTKTETTAAADSATTVKDVDKRVNEIYADVFAWYARAEKDISVIDKMPDFDTIYTSADYRDVLSKVKARDKQCEANGEMGFFDHDHWVCGQDFQNLSMKLVKTEITAPGKCTAAVDITNCGTTTRVSLDLVLENGQWMIDDFKTDNQSEKAQMKEYAGSK